MTGTLGKVTQAARELLVFREWVPWTPDVDFK